MRVVHVLVLLAASLTAASAVQFIQDELLWSRATWSDFKLQFPVQRLAVDPLHTAAAGDANTAERQDAPTGYEAQSLRGAVTPTSGTGTSPDGSTSSASPVMEVLHSDEALSQAADAVQCMVCQRFVEQAWQGLLQWLLQGPSQELSKLQLTRYLLDTCHWEVPQEILRDYVLMEGRVDKADIVQGVVADDGSVAKGIAAGDDSKAPLVMVQVSARHDEVTKVHELRAVRLACDRILASPADRDGTAHGEEGGTQGPAQLDAVLQALKEAVMTLEGVASGYKVGAANDIRLVEGTAGPLHKDSCRDHHPQCGNWAKWGECDRNPQYMQGHDEWPGNCRMSCKACSVPPYLTEKTYNRKQAAALTESAAGIVRRLEQRICTDAPPCQKGVASLLKALLDTVKQARISTSAPAAGGAAQQSRFADHGSKSWPSRWPANQVEHTRSASDALSSSLGEPVRPSGAGAETLNHGALEDFHDSKCFYLAVDWWTYELCVNHRVRQFHVTSSQSLEQISTLGVFDVEQTQAKETELGDNQQHLGTADLLPGTEGSSVPYKSQMYSSGSMCEPEPQQHLGGATRQPRSAEVRLACSPDTSTYMVVREPMACSYVITLYMPAVCGQPELTPQWFIKTSIQQQVQVALSHEVVAAAQAAAAAFHGQSEQFSVRFMTAAANQPETRLKAEVPVSTSAGQKAEPSPGGMSSEPTSDSSATGRTGLLDGARVTGLLDRARLAAGSMTPGRDVPAATATAPQADPDLRDGEAAAATPGKNGTPQPQIKEQRIIEERYSQNTDAYGTHAREQQNSPALDDADTSESERASEHSHVEL